ncbi:MAG: glycosyltransferase family 2 protein [Nitrospirota bacterium]
MDISIVIPLYNEEESLPDLHRRLGDVLSGTGKSYEIIFVDDGSTDRSLEVLERLGREDHSHVSVCSFRRNCGKSAALAAGFERARGEYVVTMDADLQDDPSEIPNLLARLGEYDLVSGWKFPRKDPLTKRIPSKVINWLTAKLTGVRIHDMNCGLKAYKSEVIKGLALYGEQHRFIPALVHADGFRVGEVKVQHHPRKFGHTKFGGKRFIEGIFDLITVLFITRYIRKPLHFFGIAGLVLLVAGGCTLGYLIVGWFLGRWIGGRPLFTLSILLIILGIQFISTGLLGEMLTSLSYNKREGGIERELPWQKR